MQLVSKGRADLHLTSDPSISFFKSVVRRTTRFAVESISQTFNGSVMPNGRSTTKISRNGDLAYRAWIEMTLPAISALVAAPDPSTPPARPAGNMYDSIKDVSIRIGGNLIDRHSGEWMRLNDELTVRDEQRENLYHMTHWDEETGWSYNRGKDVSPHIVRLPLSFWFCRDPARAIPLVALQGSDVEVSVQFTDKVVTGAKLRLWIDYVFLDAVERRSMIRRSYEYLIEQIQTTDVDRLPVKKARLKKMFLDFNHPVKELLWVIRDRDGRRRSDAVRLARLMINGEPRFADRTGSYFTTVQRYTHHTCSGKIYPGSFSEVTQPWIAMDTSISTIVPTTHSISGPFNASPTQVITGVNYAGITDIVAVSGTGSGSYNMADVAGSVRGGLLGSVSIPSIFGSTWDDDHLLVYGNTTNPSNGDPIIKMLVFRLSREAVTNNLVLTVMGRFYGSGTASDASDVITFLSQSSGTHSDNNPVNAYDIDDLVLRITGSVVNSSVDTAVYDDGQATLTTNPQAAVTTADLAPAVPIGDMKRGKLHFNKPNPHFGMFSSQSMDSTTIAVGSPFTYKSSTCSSGSVSTYLYRNDDWVLFSELFGKTHYMRFSLPALDGAGTTMAVSNGLMSPLSSTDMISYAVRAYERRPQPSHPSDWTFRNSSAAFTVAPADSLEPSGWTVDSGVGAGPWEPNVCVAGARNVSLYFQPSARGAWRQGGTILSGDNNGQSYALVLTTDSSDNRFGNHGVAVETNVAGNLHLWSRNDVADDGDGLDKGRCIVNGVSGNGGQLGVRYLVNEYGERRFEVYLGDLVLDEVDATWVEDPDNLFAKIYLSSNSGQSTPQVARGVRFNDWVPRGPMIMPEQTVTFTAATEGSPMTDAIRGTDVWPALQTRLDPYDALHYSQRDDAVRSRFAFATQAEVETAAAASDVVLGYRHFTAASGTLVRAGTTPLVSDVATVDQWPADLNVMHWANWIMTFTSDSRYGRDSTVAPFGAWDITDGGGSSIAMDADVPLSDVTMNIPDDDALLHNRVSFVEWDVTTAGHLDVTLDLGTEKFYDGITVLRWRDASSRMGAAGRLRTALSIAARSFRTSTTNNNSNALEMFISSNPPATQRTSSKLMEEQLLGGYSVTNSSAWDARLTEILADIAVVQRTSGTVQTSVWDVDVEVGDVLYVLYRQDNSVTKGGPVSVKFGYTNHYELLYNKDLVTEASGTTYSDSSTKLKQISDAQQFHGSIDLSEDGQRLVVGAKGNDPSSLTTDAGHVRVFDFDATQHAWAQVGADIDGLVAYDYSGESTVCISASGDVVAFGARGHDVSPNNNVGCIRVYELDGGTWTQRGADILMPVPSEDEGFGYSLAMDATGEVVAGGTLSTAARCGVFKWDGTAWVLRGEVRSDFGQSLSISGAGDVLAYIQSDNETGVLFWNGAEWNSLIGDIEFPVPPTPENVPWYPRTVDISRNGRRLIFGALTNSFFSSHPGGVQVFSLPPPSASTGFSGFGIANDQGVYEVSMELPTIVGTDANPDIPVEVHLVLSTAPCSTPDNSLDTTGFDLQRRNGVRLILTNHGELNVDAYSTTSQDSLMRLEDIIPGERVGIHYNHQNRTFDVLVGGNEVWSVVAPPTATQGTLHASLWIRSIVSDRTIAANAIGVRLVRSYPPVDRSGLIYMYSFALRPEEYQPSGTLNFSKIDNAVLEIETNVDRLRDIVVYAKNYNVLRINNGQGNVVFHS